MSQICLVTEKPRLTERAPAVLPANIPDSLIYLNELEEEFINEKASSPLVNTICSPVPSAQTLTR